MGIESLSGREFTSLDAIAIGGIAILLIVAYGISAGGATAVVIELVPPTAEVITTFYKKAS